MTGLLPNGRAQHHGTRSVGLHAGCTACRLRFTPDLTAYLPACPVCGEPLEPAGGPDQVLGLRLFSLEDLPSTDDGPLPPDALVVSMPVADLDH